MTTHCAFIRNDTTGEITPATSRGRLIVGTPDDLHHLLGALVVEVGTAQPAPGDATVTVRQLLDEHHAAFVGDLPDEVEGAH